MCEECQCRYQSEVRLIQSLGWRRVGNQWLPLARRKRRVVGRFSALRWARSLIGRVRYVIHEFSDIGLEWSDIANIWRESRVLRLDRRSG